MWQELTSFLSGITTGWMIIHTILLGTVICYWTTVILGFFDIDLFGEIELEGAEDGVEGIAGVFSGLIGFISMNNVPITINCSLITLIMWVLACFAHNLVNAFTETPWILFTAGLIIFIGTFVIATYVTYGITLPLRNVFKTPAALDASSIVGEICKIKTSKVTSTFGEAELTVDGSYLQISVRTSEGEFSKGDSALIFDHDTENNTYSITKIEI